MDWPVCWSAGGGKQLEEPLVVRPTSETIVNHMFAQVCVGWVGGRVGGRGQGGNVPLIIINNYSLYLNQQADRLGGRTVCGVCPASHPFLCCCCCCCCRTAPAPAPAPAPAAAAAVGPELPRPAAAHQPVGQRAPLGDAHPPLCAHPRVPVAGGPHRARHRRGGGGGDDLHAAGAVGWGAGGRGASQGRPDRLYGRQGPQRRMPWSHPPILSRLADWPSACLPALAAGVRGLCGQRGGDARGGGAQVSHRVVCGGQLHLHHRGHDGRQEGTAGWSPA